jgi:hypothetical protein
MIPQTVRGRHVAPFGLQAFVTRRQNPTVYLVIAALTMFVIETIRFWMWLTSPGALHFSNRFMGSNAAAVALAAITLVAGDYYGPPRGRAGALGFGCVLGGALANLCEHWSGAGVADYGGLGPFGFSGGDVAAAAGLLLLAPSVIRTARARVGLRGSNHRNPNGLGSQRNAR